MIKELYEDITELLRLLLINTRYNLWKIYRNFLKMRNV